MTIHAIVRGTGSTGKGQWWARISLPPALTGQQGNWFDLLMTTPDQLRAGEVVRIDITRIDGIVRVK